MPALQRPHLQENTGSQGPARIHALTGRGFSFNVDALSHFSLTLIRGQGATVKIAFVASECVPFSKTGGLADVVGALPKALAGIGHEVEVFLPRYRMTKPGPVLR